MTSKKFNGFLANKAIKREGKPSEIHTARDAKYHEGFTGMLMSDLQQGVEGNDALLDANLKALLPFKKDLKDGKRIDIYLEWQLTEDRMNYENVKVVEVRIND